MENKTNILRCDCCGLVKQCLTNMGKINYSRNEFWCRKCKLEKERHEEIIKSMQESRQYCSTGFVLVLLFIFFVGTVLVLFK